MIKIAFSFDDGRKDTVRMFYDILKPLNIPFTINVTTGYINKCIELSDYPSLNEPMSVDDLIKMNNESLIEISGHGRKHNNDCDNFIDGINDLRNILNTNSKIGLASPQCMFDLKKIPECRQLFDKNKVLYFRTGDRFYNNVFLKKGLRKINKLLKISPIYYYVYKDSAINYSTDNYVLYSAIVTKFDTLNNMKYFIRKAIKENKSFILMFHSILKPGEQFYNDTYSWDYDNFADFCKFLKRLEEENKIELIKVRDFII